MTAVPNSQDSSLVVLDDLVELPQKIDLGLHDPDRKSRDNQNVPIHGSDDSPSQPPLDRHHQVSCEQQPDRGQKRSCTSSEGVFFLTPQYLQENEMTCSGRSPQNKATKDGSRRRLRPRGEPGSEIITL